MPKRFPKPLSPFSWIWNQETADTVYEAFLYLWKGMSGLQGTPQTPSNIQAGDVSDLGTGQPPALSNHVHGVDTAAPSVDVALGGSTDEGSGSSLMRSDARLVLGQGAAVSGDSLVSDGTDWVPRPVGFDNSILGNRVFIAHRPQHVPGPDDSQVILASRIFGR